MLLWVKSDIHSAMNRQEVTCLILLDLSAAFNTVNHGILLSHLETQFSITGPALWWIKSYLLGQTWSAIVGNPKVDGAKSKPVSLTFGIPQGLVPGPILFTLYTSPWGTCVKATGLTSNSVLMISKSTWLSNHSRRGHRKTAHHAYKNALRIYVHGWESTCSNWMMIRLSSSSLVCINSLSKYLTWTWKLGLNSFHQLSMSGT